MSLAECASAVAVQQMRVVPSKTASNLGKLELLTRPPSRRASRRNALGWRRAIDGLLIIGAVSLIRLGWSRAWS